MANYYHLTPAEQKRLAEKQAAGLPLSSNERSYLRQVSQDGEQSGKRLAAVVQRDFEKAAEEATPDWEKRPRNVPAEALALYESSPGFKDPGVLRRMAELRAKAAEEDKRIDALMAAKAKQHAIDTDPETADALKHCETASASAAPEQQATWAALKGLLLGGGAAVVPDYWRRAAEITAANRQKTADALSPAGGELDKSLRRYVDRQIELEHASAQADFAADRATKKGADA